MELAEGELSRAAEARRRTLSFMSIDTALTQLILRNLLNSVFQTYQVTAKSGIRLDNQIAPELGVTALPKKQQQLVSNLVSNAWTR